MKNISHILPIAGDAISAAFGGAIIGNWLGGPPVAIVAAVAGAIIFAIAGVRLLNKRKAEDKPSTCH